MSAGKIWGRRVLKIRRSQRRYGGHYAVTRSLVEGLSALGASFNYNSVGLWGLADTVAVLSGIGVLEQAIRLKEEGRVKRLLADPNLVNLPSDARRLIVNPAVDLYLVNSDWTFEMYTTDVPKLLGRCAI